MSNLSICDMAKTCDASLSCDQAQPHDCGDYGCCIGGKFTCSFNPLARCVPVEAEPVTVKPKGSRSILMKDVIDENVTLKIENQTLKCKVKEFEDSIKTFKALPTMRRILWAVKGGAA